MAAVQTSEPTRTAGPNIFELTYEDTKITYAPIAADGSPRLHYEGPMGVHAFEGDEITTLHSARGLEISVTLDRISHLRTVTLTVFLPDLELEDATTELTFRTVGIHAVRRRTVVADMREGSSQPLELEGRARTIEFEALSL